ncbi:MAG TPA: hypothetical protein PL131_00355 [Methylotenera sp.]|nr:hypothetical protein [Methylotenera sp.]HPH04296.1 hypothetical protein [Methylotenera sp.]HPM99850.1 hypothetical protein [Methylotenera sp.]
MKKLSIKYKTSLLIKSKQSLRTHLKSKRLQNRRKLNEIKRKINEQKSTIVKIFAPEHFTLHISEKDSLRAESRNKLLRFISKIKQSLLENKRVHISFKNTNLLAPSGTLLFISEFEKITNEYSNKITIDYPKDDVVEQLFQHIGLLEKMGLPNRKEITAEQVRCWDFAKGNNVDTSEFKNLFSKYSNAISEDVSSGLFDSMSEAVTNSFQHSCGHQAECNCDKNWWMFARQQNNTLEVVIYDRGIGIPESLRRKPELKEWLRAPYERYKKKFDSTMINVAVQSTRSSTKLAHRGKGLRDMLDFVRDGNIGGFFIFSGAGLFLYSAERKNETSQDFIVPISGTLIQWQLSLN